MMHSVGFTVLLEYQWFRELDQRLGSQVLSRFMELWEERGRPSLAVLIHEVEPELRRLAEETVDSAEARHP